MPDPLTKPDPRIDHAPLKERIRYYYGPSCHEYHALMMRCFKPALHPKAWRTSSNGGPPGCVMAFVKALREMGFSITYRRDGQREVWGPSK